jgi:hypothetical protein
MWYDKGSYIKDRIKNMAKQRNRHGASRKRILKKKLKAAQK